MGERIRVFIGTEPKTEVARLVLQHSIVQHTDEDVEFVPMIGPAWEYPAAGIKFGTGFSLRRWMIPAYCGWEGRAVYLDADQLVFGDVRELWDRARGNVSAVAAWTTWQPDKVFSQPSPQTSVMVIDCAKARAMPGWHLDQALARLKADGTAKGYQTFMHGLWMDPLPGKLPVEWNHLCRYHEGKTKLLHYTSVPNQPWYKPDDPLAYPWRLAFIRASSMGALPPEVVKEAVARFGTDARGEPTGLHPDYAPHDARPTRPGWHNTRRVA